MNAQSRLRKEGGPIPPLRQIGFGDNGRFTNDPEEHHHFCIPIPWEELERRQLYRKVKEDVRGKDFSSSQAVGMLNQAIAEKRMNPAERQQFNRSMPSTRSLKRMLRKVTAPADYPADFGIEDIPPELQNSPFEGGGLLAHFGTGGANPFLLMMDENLRDIFRLATDIIVDGTFDCAPKKDQNVYQIYTIVAVFADYPMRQMSIPVGAVFLKNKTEATYTQMFQKLLEFLDNDIGVNKRFHFDQEAAAINAARHVFRQFEVEILNCYFHYQKNLKEYARNECSVQLYRDSNFRKWLRIITGASHLPRKKQMAQFQYQQMMAYNRFRFP